MPTSLALTSAAVFFALALGASQGVQPAEFEVASVKFVKHDFPLEALNEKNHTYLPAGHLFVSGRRLLMKDEPLDYIIASAFRMRIRQIVGPAWLSQERFDIEAIIPPDEPINRVNEMLQTLLRQRFNLQGHPGVREQSGYSLTVGKRGTNLKVTSVKPSEKADPLALIGHTAKAFLVANTWNSPVATWNA